MYSICTAKIKPISCIYYLLSKPTSSINSSFVAAKRLFLISKSAVLSLISWPNLAFGLYLSNFSAKGYPPISKIRSKALSIKSCAPELTRLATLDASRATKEKVIKRDLSVQLRFESCLPACTNHAFREQPPHATSLGVSITTYPKRCF